MLHKWIRKARQKVGHYRFLRAQKQFERVNVFFLLGMGRSGTNFFASLLKRCPAALVYHEPMDEDFIALEEAHESFDNALSYLKYFRLQRMHKLIQGQDIHHYGEANSNLRFHARAIREVMPNARLLHLVRDGREVVRSVMERRHYTPGTSGHHALQPLPSDPLYERWDELSRFEKVCWLWADANRRLAEDVPNWVSFESLVGDYDYFKENLLDFIGLEMSEAQWSEIVRAPTNVTKKFTFPPWQEWDVSQNAAFDAICGKQMSRFGYGQS